jgi:hypothetical protein
MKLIDRYVTEVGRHLPLFRGRKDIENELRSTLEDMLEDRAKKAGRPADEALEMDLLRVYGSPDKVASAYNPMPYLIGPRMFPFFMMILKIAVSVVTVVLLVLLGVQISTQSPMTGMEFAKAIGEGLLGIVSAAIAAFGNIVLVFAILERFVPTSEFKLGEEKEWDPLSLKKEPEPEEIKPWEPIFTIVITFIAISIFNFNPQLIGFYFFSEDAWVVIPALTDAFFRWLPLINISWVAEIILNGMLLRSGRWGTPTRLFSMAIKVLQIAIGYFLLSGPSIFAITPESLNVMQGLDVELPQILGILFQQAGRGIIALIMVIEGIDLVKIGYRLITQRR